MTRKKKKTDPAALRQRAEKQLTPPDGPGDGARLLHELQVHQVELELQNDELQRAYDEVEEGLARYTELYEFAPVGYLSLAPDGNIRQMNLTAERLLGAERARLIGTPFRWLLREASRAAFDGFLARLGSTPAACEVEVGESILELTGRAGDSTENRIIATDVTERRRVATAQLTGDRLASLGILAGGIAHEINNPLTFVLHAVDHVARELSRIDTADAREAAERAREALGGLARIKELAKALRSFSSSEHVARSAVDPLESLETALSLVTNEIRFRARLVKELVPLPAVRAAKGELTQVFLNLLLNAAHSIAEGDSENQRITLRTAIEAEHVVIEVEDSGAGIDPDSLAHIFDPFTTLGADRNPGLRLAVCRNIVVQLGGEIGVLSTRGKGTKFRVRLPSTSLAPATVTPPRSPRRGRVLIVDDEPMIRRLLERLLRADHDVVAVESGSAALATLETDPAFDVILCDLMMPDVTGMEAHRRTALRDPALAARFVFVSGGAFTPLVAEYLERSGNRTVSKPFDGDELKQLIAELVAASAR